MRRVGTILLFASLIGLVAAVNYLRPVDGVEATPTIESAQRVPGQQRELAWPAGAGAVAVSELGLLGVHGPTSPQPMASVAKVMTALVVMTDHPLTPLEQGENVLVTAGDFAEFLREKSDGQSVVAVEPDEQLTERQLLEGMLIPSANNLANLLARWDAGSGAAFVDKMNARAIVLGMKQSKFADPTGLSELTVGSPADLILAGEALMADPVLAQIVGEAQVDLPVAGTVFNVNYALGEAGLVGIKTGSTPKAGACFLFAATTLVGGRRALIVGAVMGEPTLESVFAAAERLVASVVPGLRLLPAVSASERVAEYRAPWGARSSLLAERDLSLVGWPGMILHRQVHAPAMPAPLKAGESGGRFDAWVGAGPVQTVALVMDHPLRFPDDAWRLTRPLSDRASG